VSDAVERQKEDAEGCSDDDADRGKPAECERLVEHRGWTIELLARRQQQHGQRQEESRLAERQALD
jgi:hypothetical protein